MVRPELIEAFRKALRHVEESERLHPDDPSLLELKKFIARTIAELELQQKTAA
jgi:hypothetical protein